MTAEEIIRALNLKPHPEGGHFRETFRDAQVTDGRASSTAIYYLLKAARRATGTASTPPRFGISTAAIRWSCRSRPTAS